MLRTAFCNLLGIEAPVVQAAIAPATTAELVAAVSNAGGLGSFATALRTAADVRAQIERIRALTDRPFAVNFTLATFDEEAFEAALAARPAVISTALGDPGALVERAHAAGCRLMHQVHTVGQAREAVARGVDVVIAQGSEAGGFCGAVGALALVPQVVDAVAPVPVVAAGGIVDGRGLAAALVLGAQGANIGTRFLASEEAGADPAWQAAILAAEAEDAVRVEPWYEVFPAPPPGAYPTAPRALRNAFLDAWLSDRDAARADAPRLQAEIIGGARGGRSSEYVAFTGQSAGAVRDVLPAAAIVRRLVREAQEALAAGRLVGT